MSRCIITYVDEANGLPLIDQPLVQRLVDAALAEDDQTFCQLTVLLVDDAGSAELHEAHFDDSEPTDVMTFPDGSDDPDSERCHLGDLAVGVEVAQRQASERGRPTGDELALYILHGVLHLLGYDDEHPEDQKAMWAVQVRLLGAEGIPLEAEPS